MQIQTPDQMLSRIYKKNYLDVVSILIQNGASINAVDNDNNTPLHIAAGRGYVPSTLLLLCFGTAIDEKALEYDKTALLRVHSYRRVSRDMIQRRLMFQTVKDLPHVSPIILHQKHDHKHHKLHK